MGETMGSDSIAIIIGSDHAAFALKQWVKAYLEKRGIPVEDAGVHSDQSSDYPAYARAVAGRVSSGEFRRGILLCGTGLGMSMAANRFPNVRAALCNDLFSAKMSRLHNDANILVMGGRVIGDVLAGAIVDTWLETDFEGGRHQRRLEMFDRIETLRDGT